MIVVVDSSVVIDLLRARAPALDVLVQANERNWRLACSILTKVEILRGMRPEEEPGTRNLLAAFDWIEVDDTIAEIAGELGRRFFRSHQGIGATDLVVAATVIQIGGELWTTNLRHFPMFPDLAAPY
jgi:predicted nucleic acid-binding protein